jgi:hypothetical protein
MTELTTCPHFKAWYVTLEATKSPMSIFRENIHITFASFWGILNMENTTPQVCFRNVRQYCAYLCFNHCFFHLIRFLLGPCGPYSTLIWPPGDFFSTNNWFGQLRDWTKRSAKFLNTLNFKGPHRRVSHRLALSKHPLDLWRALWKFQNILMSSYRDLRAVPNRWAFETAPFISRFSSYRGGGGSILARVPLPSELSMSRSKNWELRFF